VTAGAAVALAVAAPFAVGDWWSRLRHDRRVELVCKPATLVALLAAAALLEPASGAADRRAWFVAALALSLAGDVALVLPGRFVAGLAAFLAAHLCYVAGFWTDPPAAGAAALAAVVVAAVVGPVGARLVGALRASPAAADRALVVPVAGYVTVISAMVVSALAAGPAPAGIGAVAFAASDSLIGWDRFVRPLRWAPVTIMVTYHAGQALLVTSLLL
jgi:uncharacterized membrane protein YhhN